MEPPPDPLSTSLDSSPDNCAANQPFRGVWTSVRKSDSDRKALGDCPAVPDHGPHVRHIPPTEEARAAHLPRHGREGRRDGRSVPVPARPSAAGRQRLAVRRRRRLVPGAFHLRAAAVRPQQLAGERQAGAHPAAAGRVRAAAGSRQGPQRPPGRGRRLDGPGLTLEPGRRRHGDGDLRRTRRAGAEVGGRRRGGRTGAAVEQHHHGLLVRLPGGARTAPPGTSPPAPGTSCAATTRRRSPTPWTAS